MNERQRESLDIVLSIALCVALMYGAVQLAGCGGRGTPCTRLQVNDAAATQLNAAQSSSAPQPSNTCTPVVR